MIEFFSTKIRIKRIYCYFLQISRCVGKEIIAMSLFGTIRHSTHLLRAVRNSYLLGLTNRYLNGFDIFACSRSEEIKDLKGYYLCCGTDGLKVAKCAGKSQINNLEKIIMLNY